MAYRIGLQAVTSSNLHAVGYDADKRILAVQFKDGRIWHYAGVSADLWAELQSAQSKGSFYSLLIRGKFQAEKMTGDCPKCGDFGYIGETCEECGCDVYKGATRHAIEYDHPVAASTRQKPTVCGTYVKPSEIANNPDDVTCSDCRAKVAERDALSADDVDDMRRG